MPKDNGGNVFALACWPPQPGIARRDWLAGLAIAASRQEQWRNPEEAAVWAYQIADALIAEGNKES